MPVAAGLSCCWFQSPVENCLSARVISTRRSGIWAEIWVERHCHRFWQRPRTGGSDLFLVLLRPVRDLLVQVDYARDQILVFGMPFNERLDCAHVREHVLEEAQIALAEALARMMNLS